MSAKHDNVKKNKAKGKTREIFYSSILVLIASSLNHQGKQKYTEKQTKLMHHDFLGVNN
jgi:hypothetical protein